MNSIIRLMQFLCSGKRVCDICWILGAGTTIFVSCMVSAQEISVLTPTSEEIVAPDSVIDLAVDVTPNPLDYTVKIFLLTNSSYGVIHAELDNPSSTSPTHVGDIYTPKSLSGPQSLTFVLYDIATDEPVDSVLPMEVVVNVVPSGVPVKILGRDHLFLEYPDSLNSTFNNGISLAGKFPDGEGHSLAFDFMGVNYTVRDPSVIDVSADGSVTTKALGNTIVKSEYLGLEWFTRVGVVPDRIANDGINDTSAPNEVTAQLLIEFSGLRRNVSTGLFNQVVTLTNNGIWPIVYPTVVISQLPDSVSVKSWYGTKIVLPLESDVIPHFLFLENKSGKIEALFPSETTKLQLEFFNPSGISVDYELRVFEENGGV